MSCKLKVPLYIIMYCLILPTNSFKKYLERKYEQLSQQKHNVEQAKIDLEAIERATGTL